jgi:hypothetical protein
VDRNLVAQVKEPGGTVEFVERGVPGALPGGVRIQLEARGTCYGEHPVGREVQLRVVLTVECVAGRA